MPQHELHPLCTLFPRVVGAEFDALVADIRAHGLRQPITLHAGMILDGGNRYRACIEAGVEPTFAEFTGGNLVSFVLSANLHRRHMTPGQQAAIVASAQDWAKAQPKGGTGANQHGKREQKCNVAPLLDTAASRAAESGASLRTQKAADKVAREAPELARKVAHGEMSLPAAVKEISPAKPVNDDHDDDGPSLSELVDELQAENARLTALIEAAEADDLAAEAIKWRRYAANAERQQSEAMDKARRAQKESERIAKILHAACKAAGVDDPRKLVAAIRGRAAA